MLVSDSGLVTITGGKWTTYRHMAEDCVNHAITLGNFAEKECATKNLKIHGYLEGVDSLDSFGVYGSDIDAIRAIAAKDSKLSEVLHPALPGVMEDFGR